MDSYDFARYQYEWSACNGSRSSRAKFFRANFGNPQDLDMYSTLPTHDWQDEVMGENPLNYSTNVTVGGGTEKCVLIFLLLKVKIKVLLWVQGYVVLT